MSPHKNQATRSASTCGGAVINMKIKHFRVKMIENFTRRIMVQLSFEYEDNVRLMESNHLFLGESFSTLTISTHNLHCSRLIFKKKATAGDDGLIVLHWISNIHPIKIYYF